TLVRNARWPNYVVAHIYLQFAIFNHRSQKSRDVPRIQLTGVNGHGRCEICWCDDGDSITLDCLISLCQCAVAASCTSEIDHHRSTPHTVNCFFGDQERSTPTGNLSGC